MVSSPHFRLYRCDTIYCYILLGKGVEVVAWAKETATAPLMGQKWCLVLLFRLHDIPV
jgi:hypothetical protein